MGWLVANYEWLRIGRMVKVGYAQWVDFSRRGAEWVADLQRTLIELDGLIINALVLLSDKC